MPGVIVENGYMINKSHIIYDFINIQSEGTYITDVIIPEF